MASLEAEKAGRIGLGHQVDFCLSEPLFQEDRNRHLVSLGVVHPARLAEIVEEMRGKGIDKPIVVSLAGDVEVEEASEYLFDHKIPAYPYSTEIPVDVLGAKYKWARGAGWL